MLVSSRIYCNILQDIMLVSSRIYCNNLTRYRLRRLHRNRIGSEWLNHRSSLQVLARAHFELLSSIDLF